MESEVISTNVADNRRRFIAALRSGKYKQYRGEYINPTEPECRCALGVCASLCGLDPVQYARGMWFFELPVRGRAERFLQDRVDDIIVMNDVRKLTFSEIADTLEVKWGK